jgi:hypothetical protein
LQKVITDNEFPEQARVNPLFFFRKLGRSNKYLLLVYATALKPKHPEEAFHNPKFLGD